MEQWEHLAKTLDFVDQALNKPRKDNPMPHAHTPGPWKVAGIYILGSERETVVCQMDSNDKYEQANARLIAAAPMLLAWLEREYTRCAPLSTHGRELAALITRATGRERGQ